MTGMGIRRLLGGCYVVLVAGVVVFLLLPIVVVFISAFDGRSYLGYFPPRQFSLRWFRYVASNDYLLRGLVTSLVVGVGAAGVAVVTGFMAAVAVARVESKWTGVLTTVFLSPVIIPGVVLGFGLLTYFSLVGVRNSFAKLLIAHVLIGFPYALRVCLASLMGFNRDIEDAAINLGAHPVRAFVSVTIPVVRPGLIAASVFAFSFSLDDVSVSVFLTDPWVYTLPVAMMASLKARYDASIAVVSVGLVAVATMVVLIIERVAGIDRFISVALGKLK